VKILIFIILFSPLCEAKMIRLAIIDSGLDTSKYSTNICPDGLYDLTLPVPGRVKTMTDDMGHANNIIGIISDKLKNTDYCLYVFKVYSKNTLKNPFLPHLMAFFLVLKLGNIDIVNYSSSGSHGITMEQQLFNAIMKKGAKIIVAAGNDNKDLDKKCDAYPACYGNVISVGNINVNGERAPLSNYGKVIKVWRMGEDICYNDLCLSGTSQATAVYSAELALEMSKKNGNR